MRIQGKSDVDAARIFGRWDHLPTILQSIRADVLLTKNEQIVIYGILLIHPELIAFDSEPVERLKAVRRF